MRHTAAGGGYRKELVDVPTGFHRLVEQLVPRRHRSVPSRSERVDDAMTVARHLAYREGVGRLASDAADLVRAACSASDQEPPGRHKLPCRVCPTRRRVGRGERHVHVSHGIRAYLPHRTVLHERQSGHATTPRSGRAPPNVDGNVRRTVLMRAAASRSACNLTASRVVDVLVRDAGHDRPSLALLHDVMVALYDVRMARHLRDRQSDRSGSACVPKRIRRACADGEPVLRVERPSSPRPFDVRVRGGRREQEVSDAPRTVGEDVAAAPELDARHVAPPDGLRRSLPYVDGDVKRVVVCPPQSHSSTCRTCIYYLEQHQKARNSRRLRRCSLTWS